MSISEDLFARFKKMISGGLESKKQFFDICRDTYHLQLKDDEVVIKDSVAWIKAGAAVKNKLFIIKNPLLEDLKKVSSPIRDIRF